MVDMYRTPRHARFVQLMMIAGFERDADVAAFLGLDASTVSRYLSDDPKKHRDPSSRVLELFEHKLEARRQKLNAERGEIPHPIGKQSAEQNRVRGVPMGTPSEKGRTMKYPDHEEGHGHRFQDTDPIVKKIRQLTPEDRKEIEHIVSYKLRARKQKTADDIAVETQDDAAKIAGIKKSKSKL